MSVTRVAVIAIFAVALLLNSANASETRESTAMAYVAALDVASLPYGEYEWDDSKRLIEERYTEMLRDGEIDHGILWSGMFYGGGSSATGEMLAILLYGASEEQASALLDAAAGARNVVNPRLITATVFFPEALVLPKSGMVHDNGGLTSVNEELVYLPESAEVMQAQATLKAWYKQHFGKEAEVSIGREKPEYPFSVSFREPFKSEGSYRVTAENITPEQKRLLNFSTVQRNWSTADNSKPWFDGELPMQPLLTGHKWVKGYQVNLMRMDAASDETVARLRADAAELARRVRGSYPGAAIVEQGPGMNLTPPYLLNGHLTQPGLTLLVAVDDQALLENIGAELKAKAAADSGHANIMWVSASYRCIFLDEAAVADEPITSGVRVVNDGLRMVLPTWVSDQQARAEADNWRDQWIELYRQARHPTDLW